jgi:hypothetical protein
MLAATYFLARAQSDDRYTTRRARRPPEWLAWRRCWVGTTDEPGREQPAGEPCPFRGCSVSASPIVAVFQQPTTGLARLRLPRRCRIRLRTRRACPPCRTFSKRSLQPRAVGPTSSRRAAASGILRFRKRRWSADRAWECWHRAAVKRELPATHNKRGNILVDPGERSANVVRHCCAAARHYGGRYGVGYSDPPRPNDRRDR